jgi:hypothetical protein
MVGRDRYIGRSGKGKRRQRCNLDSHLRGAAFWTERTSVLNLGSTLFAGMFHPEKLAHAGEESKSDRPFVVVQFETDAYQGVPQACQRTIT